MDGAGGHMPKHVTFCPYCLKPVEARDYLGNAAVMGFLDSVLPVIDCRCGYEGLPIKLALKQYEKLVKERNAEVIAWQRKARKTRNSTRKSRPRTRR